MLLAASSVPPAHRIPAETTDDVLQVANMELRLCHAAGQPSGREASQPDVLCSLLPMQTAHIHTNVAEVAAFSAICGRLTQVTEEPRPECREARNICWDH